MKNHLLLLISLLLFVNASGQTPSGDHFYNVDNEVRIEGAIQNIRFEPRYKDKAPFLVVLLEDSSGGGTYSVEVSPSWFFDQDLHKGERVKVIGSLTGESEGMKSVIARQVNLRGETITLRDKKGFPSWSGGARTMKRKRRSGSL